MAEGNNKCAHETCSCTTGADTKYCSSFCEDSKDIITLMCKCGHPECGQQATLQSSGGSVG
jgi:hypothetical protein